MVAKRVVTIRFQLIVVIREISTRSQLLNKHFVTQSLSRPNIIRSFGHSDAKHRISRHFHECGVLKQLQDSKEKAMFYLGWLAVKESIILIMHQRPEAVRSGTHQ